MGSVPESEAEPERMVPMTKDQKKIKSLQEEIVQSMSRPGYPYDNAPMERYFNTLKAELINLHSYKSEDALYDAVTRYAFGWYNNQRPHTYNKGLPPAKVA